MGTVFRAVQQPIGRQVAVKVLHPDLAQDDTFITRFHTEAKAASVLVNPNTVTIFDFGQTDDGSLFIAMEYLAGASLAERLSVGPLVWQQAVVIGVQVCRALAEAHRKGIVHRDLKPENIMLNAADDGSLLVKVLDFGIAKMLEAPGRGVSGMPVTQVGVIIGTPQYMSPEQARGGEPSPASDLYALGIILHEAISGDVPFEDEEPILLLSKHMRAAPPPLVSPLGDVPESLCQLVLNLLAKDHNDRPPSAGDVAAILRQIVGPCALSAAEVIGEAEPGGHLDSGPPPSGTVPGAQGRAVRHSHSRRLGLGALGAAPTEPGVNPSYLDRLHDSSSSAVLPGAVPHLPGQSGMHRALGGESGALALGTDSGAHQLFGDPSGAHPAFAGESSSGTRDSEVSDDDEAFDGATTAIRYGSSASFRPAVAVAVAGRRESAPASPSIHRRGILWALGAAIVVLLVGALTGLVVFSGGEPARSAPIGSGGPKATGVVAHGSGAAPDDGDPSSVASVATVAAHDAGQVAAHDAGQVAAHDAGQGQAGNGAAASTVGADSGREMAVVEFTSAPPRARVMVGDDHLCTTPCASPFPSGQAVKVRFVRRRMEPQWRTIEPGRDQVVHVLLRRRVSRSSTQAKTGGQRSRDQRPAKGKLPLWLD
jgi:serine/threonine protein kinase